jgi:hypothetical protein
MQNGKNPCNEDIGAKVGPGKSGISAAEGEFGEYDAPDMRSEGMSDPKPEINKKSPFSPGK